MSTLNSTEVDNQTFNQVRETIKNTLDLPGPVQRFTVDTPLFGAIPELDSMGVVLLLTALEDRFDLQFPDDEINADWFATFGTVAALVEQQIEQ